MLAARFQKNSNQLQSNTALTTIQMREVAPSIFASGKHESRSDRYSYIPTSEVLNGLQKEGFQPYMVAQSKSRIEGKQEFTKHLIRLRHAESAALAEIPEVIVINSHDGTSSYQLLAGVFRFVCMNGMVCGDNIEEVRVHHKGNIVESVVQGAFNIVDNFKQVQEHVGEMKALPMTQDEQQLFGNLAIQAKYDDPEKAAPITVAQVIEPKRSADSAPNVWNVFNRAQESLMRGGLSATTANGRRTRTRPVQGIDTNVKVNRLLWNLADGFRRLKNGEGINDILAAQA